MRTVSQPTCPVCQSGGAVLYSALRDGVFSAPGEWSMRSCKNTACGLLWLDPAPDPRDLSIAYAGYYTHSQSHDDLTSHLRMGSRREMVAHMLGYPSPHDVTARLLGRLLLLSPRRREHARHRWFHLPYVRQGRVLEIGCGAGLQLATLRDSGWSTVGIEVDRAAAQAARALGLEILEGELRTLRLEAASFDAIVMGHVIEHVPDPAGLFAECHRLLRPAGVLISVTPNAKSLGHRIFGQDWRGLEPPRHLSIFTAKALIQCAKNAGFATSRIRVTARDAANVLLSSSRISHLSPGHRIEAPSAERLPPLGFRVVEHIERACCSIGLGMGEELVLTAIAGDKQRAT